MDVNERANVPSNFVLFRTENYLLTSVPLFLSLVLPSSISAIFSISGRSVSSFPVQWLVMDPKPLFRWLDKTYG